MTDCDSIELKSMSYLPKTSITICFFIAPCTLFCYKLLHNFSRLNCFTFFMLSLLNKTPSIRYEVFNSLLKVERIPLIAIIHLFEIWWVASRLFSAKLEKITSFINNVVDKHNKNKDTNIY